MPLTLTCGRCKRIYSEGGLMPQMRGRYQPRGCEMKVSPKMSKAQQAALDAADARLWEMQVDLFRRYWSMLNDALPLSWQEEAVAAWRVDLQRYERAAAALLASGVPELSAIAEREAPLAHEGGVQQALAF